MKEQESIHSKEKLITPEVLANLRKAIELMTGREIQTPRDFESLRQKLKERLDAEISISTLKRLFGYVHTDNMPSVYTLDVLARFCGYKSLKDFCNNSEEVDSVSASSPLLGRTLNVPTELRPGDRVRICWQPGRVCEVEYNGSLHFRVVYSEKTRLKPGDTFLTSLLVEGCPLTIYLQQLDSMILMPYICGQISGITYSKLDKKKEKEQ